MKPAKIFPYSKALLPIFLLLISSVTLAQTPTGSSNGDYIPKEVTSQLLALAEEAITTQYQILVSGDFEGSLKNKKLAHLYREAMMSQFSAQVYRRNKLKETRQDYKDFKTELTINLANKQGNKIVLNITEHTTLKLDIPSGPEATEFKQDHLFEFNYEKQQWRLIKDTIIRPEPSPINKHQLLPNNIHMTPLTHAPKGYLGKKIQGGLTNMDGFGAYFIPASFISSSPQSGFNRVAAVNYARTFALTYNPLYFRFRNDCTNFTSQTMLTGGWQMSGLGAGLDRSDPDSWYYSCLSLFRPVATYSWGAAYNFNVFALRAGRVEGIQYYEDLNPGDIIFADWDSLDGTHQPDGRVDHIMIVTGKDTDGNVYVSYHTNDHKDRSMTDISIAEPIANFYGDIVR